MVDSSQRKAARMITRRRLIGTFSAAVGASLASKYAVPAFVRAATPDKVVVGVWGGAWGDAVKASVGDPFEKKYGVKVEYAHGGDTERKAKMRAEKGRQTLDVAYWTPSAAYVIATELNALVPLSEKKAALPNIADLYKGMYEPQIWTKWSVAPWTYAWTLLYRADKIPAADAAKVNSWREIFNPKWKGKVGWPNINWGNGWGLLTLALMQGEGTVESGKPHDIEKAWALVPQLKGQVTTFYGGDDEAATLLKSGETWLTLRSTFETYSYEKEGAPIKMWTKLKEGMVATNESMSIVRSGDAAREDLAAKWINMQLSPESQEILATHFFTPSNRKAKIPGTYKDKVLSVLEVQSLNHFDWIWMGKMLDSWTEKWNHAIS
jgi:spermidine/putrescine-binding protein